VLKSAVESVVTSKTPDGELLDIIRSQAAQQSCRVDIASGHFRWFGPASFKHQLVTHRLAAQVMNSDHTVCLNASVQYQNDNLRSHDISVWREAAKTITKNLVPNSDTRVDGVKVSPYVVVEIISPSSGQKDELDIKQLCAAYGVKFFWLIHPTEGWLQVYDLSREAPSDHIHRYTKSDARQIIPPFDIEIDLADIFR
jgi:Uma2 family endonuclease